MGHSWRDMDPEGAARSDRLSELRSRLLKQVRAVKLKDLTVGHIMDLVEVLKPSYNLHDFNEQDASRLNNIIKQASQKVKHPKRNDVDSGHHWGWSDE